MPSWQVFRAMPNSRPDNLVFLFDGARTPIGYPYRGLKEFSAAQLAVFAIKGLCQRGKINKRWIDQVILGNVVAAGTGQNLARQAAVAAGLPATVPAFTVNNVCGAGLQAVILAAQGVALGKADLIFAGGTESASQSPYFVKRVEAENYEKKTRELNPLDCLQHDGLLCQMTGQKMGELAQKLAREFDIPREEQDDYAFDSHRKACLAQKQGKFRKEIIPLRNHEKTITFDEHPRKGLERAWLDKLPPVFWTGGTVTAGNSSPSCDGAAVVAVGSADFQRKYKRKPLARVVGYTSIAVTPENVFESTATAIEACLKECRLQSRDIDFFEISEAFAAQVVLAQRKTKIPRAKINVFGGDLALGHPLGTAGTRILVTLMNVLRDRKKKRGLACVSFGGGGAIAMVIERAS